MYNYELLQTFLSQKAKNLQNMGATWIRQGLQSRTGHIEGW